jgi:hypothetical protein
VVGDFSGLARRKTILAIGLLKILGISSGMVAQPEDNGAGVCVGQWELTTGNK